MTKTGADRAPQTTTARTPVRAPATQGLAGKSVRSAALSRVQRATGNRGLTTLLAERRVPLQRVRRAHRAGETQGAATTTSARDDKAPAAGSRAVQRLLPPSPVTLQRKGPSLSGLKKAIGLGKKKSPPGQASAAGLRILPTAVVRPGATNEATTASSSGASSPSPRGGAPIPYGQGDEAGSGIGGPIPHEQANEAGSGSESEGSGSSRATDPYTRGLLFAAAAAASGSASSESSESSSESSESNQYARGRLDLPDASGSESSESSESSSESSESNQYTRGLAVAAALGGPYRYRNSMDFPEASGSESSESSESSSESSDWDLSPPPRPFAGQQGTESSDSESSGDEPAKHWMTKERDLRYKDEFTQGSKDLPAVLADASNWVRTGRIASVDDYMKQHMGWSQEDCDKYLKPGGPRPVVTKVRRAGRAAMELHGGSSLTQGDSNEPFDTSSMYSKFMGTGYSIYVMDKRGRLYAAQHKVGIFHHSSFLAGGDVAGAGEMKVVGGVIKTITNKSGHYLPTEAEMVQVMRELQSRGVDLSAVQYIPIGSFFGGGINAKDPYPGGAKKFLEDNG